MRKTSGTTSKNLLDRKIHRLAFPAHGRGPLWRGYSPSGNAVVAGNVIKAAARVNRKREKGSWDRCASDMQSKRSLSPFSLCTFMDRHPSAWRGDPEVRMWASTNPLDVRRQHIQMPLVLKQPRIHLARQLQ